MNNIFKLSGFPTEISDSIEIPSVAELLKMNFYQYADLEQVYKNGGSFYKKLLDLAPLRNDRKYSMVTSRVQYLQPEAVSIVYLENWHVDGENKLHDSNDLVHLLISDCTAKTVFNINSIDIEVDSDENLKSFNRKLKQVDFGLVGKSIDPCKFVTFDISHAHKAVNAKIPEFRFMFRIVESDVMKPLKYEELKNSFVFKDIDGEITEVKNIQKYENGIFINM